MRKIPKIINIALISMLLLGSAYSYDSLLRPEAGFDEDRKAEMFEKFKEAFKQQYGGKTLGVIELTKFAKQFGFKVPYFDKIGTEIFNGFLEHNSITRTKINEIYARHLVDKTSQQYRKQVPHFFDWIGVNPYHPDAYREVLDLFYKGQFSKEQEAQLRQVFDKIRKKGFPVIAIRSSSILEDTKEHQFKGVYDSKFLYFSEDTERDFEEFKEKIKMVYASIFSPQAKAYRLENNISDEDEMGILVQRVVGNIYHDSRFYPPLSGVTLFNPYNPNATISDVSLGLNTKTVRGEYRYRVAYITDSSGKRHYSGSFPCWESHAGRHDTEYDYIDTAGRLVENFADYTFSGSEKQYRHFEIYKADQKEFLSKTKNDFSGRKFSDEFTSRMDYIAKRIRELIGVPVELEWSVDDEGEINIYQRRFSYDFGRFFLQNVPLETVPSERIVAQSNIVSGHGELLAPMIAIPDIDSLNYPEQIWQEIRDTVGCEGYILVTNIVELTSQTSRAVAYFISYNFPNMIGLLNISNEPIPLAAHWSEDLIRKNILIISTTSINQKLLNQVCDQVEDDVRYSRSLVKMAVNGIEQKGHIYSSITPIQSDQVTLTEELKHIIQPTDL